MNPSIKSNKNIPPSSSPSVKLNAMSEEQSEFYKAISNGYNAIGDACAGSGKSTTVLSIASLLPDKQIVQLTYNSMLCEEISKKIQELNLTNIQVYTYHKIAVKYYDAAGHKDAVIREIIENKTSPKKTIPPFDILVIDEAQDMSFLYFKLVVQFCKDMGHPIQILVLGDFRQGLYEFKGADIRFLTSADKIWSKYPLLKSNVFQKLTLKMSYRITNQMADFVNHVMLGEKRLHACREGNPVFYIRRNRFQFQKYILSQIRTLLENGNAPSDIFILCASVKESNKHMCLIENSLVENNIPCYVPSNENDKIDERVTNGKVVFSTFHSVKGRQRKHVFVSGFNQSYFKFYAKGLTDTECPNTLYVACTRATDRLYIIENENDKDGPPKFIQKTHGEMKSLPYIHFNGVPRMIYYEKEEDKKEVVVQHIVKPTDLVKFIAESVLEEIIPILKTIFIRITPIQDYVGEGTSVPNLSDIPVKLDIPNIILTEKGYYEEVSDLNGIAIPNMYFDKIRELSGDRNNSEPDSEPTSTHSLYTIIQQFLDSVPPYEYTFLKKKFQYAPKTCEKHSDYLYLANLYVTMCDKLYFKLNQIQEHEYTWFTDEMRDKCFERISTILGEECKRPIHIEYPVGYVVNEKENENKNIVFQNRINAVLSSYFPNDEFLFHGRLDLLTEETIWELKCTNDTENEHFLQVCIYAWIWRVTMEDIEHFENIRDFKLFNIKTGEVYLLHATIEQLTQMVVALLKNKYGEKEIKPDVDFILECEKYLDTI
jgi:hypothetical protein